MNNKNDTALIYHGSCYDGHGAAWAFYQKFKDTIDYIPGYYGQPFPEGYSKYYIADFSYPYETLIEKDHLIIKILDHHISARDDLINFNKARGKAIFNNNKSGARLAWEYLYPKEKIPHLILYLEDRDLWRFNLPDSRLVHDWIQSFPFNFKAWDRINVNLELHFEDVVLQEAKAINRFKNQIVDNIVNNAVMTSILDYKVPIVNATAFYSEVGHELCVRYPESKFSVYYFDRMDNRRQFGLRSIGNFDVSEIAKKFKGGGHKNASGFILSDNSINPLAP